MVGEVVGYGGRLVFDVTKPDGTPRKLMDVGLLSKAGWSAKTSLMSGLDVAYAEFCVAVDR